MVKPKCFMKSLLTIGLLFGYLFLLDFIWLLLPEVSSGLLLIGTLAMLGVSFKLATITSTKIFGALQSF